MSNILEAIEVEVVPNDECGHMLGTEIIFPNGEKVIAIDVAQENQLGEAEFEPEKIGGGSDVTGEYIALLSDGTIKILKNENLVDEIQFIGEVVKRKDRHNDLSQLEFSCLVEGCGKTFISPSQLKAHQRKHNGIPSHECDYCNKKFSTGYALKAHKRTHTGEKPYLCSETTCQKRFKTSGDLQKHIRTHTGERPFKCEVCSKAFTTSNIRKVHMRVHTGEKPYVCTHEGCERRFSSATNYRNHLRIHTGEKPYVCSVQNCQKRFTEYSSLYKHYTIHSQKKKYECTLCNRQYRQLSTLNLHINTNHKEKAAFDNEADKMPSNEIGEKCFKPAPVRCAVKTTPDANYIPEQYILEPKSGAALEGTDSIIFGQEDRVFSEQFIEVHAEAPHSLEGGKDTDEHELYFTSDVDQHDTSSLTTSVTKDDDRSPTDFSDSLKTISCGSDAIFVLAVDPESEEPSLQVDADS